MSQTLTKPIPVDEPRARAATRSVADYLTLTKPRITAMVVITTWVGYALAASIQPTGGPGLVTLLATLIGAAWSCMGASVLNQCMEIDTDARMQRTRRRPLPAGRIGPSAALIFGLTLCAAGLAVLAFGANPLAAVISGLIIAIYTLIYTPMKRLSPISTIVGAVPGAMPPLIGYAAVTGTLAIPAWLAFGVMFVWQVPHFLAIAWLYRDDYARGGFPMWPVIDPSGRAAFRRALVGCVILLPLGVAPTFLGVAGWVHGLGSILAGAAFLALAVQLSRTQTREAARRLFLASLVYLPLVLGLMVFDAV